MLYVKHIQDWKEKEKEKNLCFSYLRELDFQKI